MRRFKSHSLKNYSIKGLVLFIIITILFNTIFLFYFYTNSISNKMDIIINRNLNNINNYLTNHIVGIKSLKYIDIDDILNIKKDKNEIQYIDFNLKNSYKMLGSLTNDFEKYLKNNNFSFLKNENEFKKKDKILYLNIPLGAFSNNYFLSSFGPKIPIKINLASSISSSLYIDVKNYGINNCLIKLYLNLNIFEDIMIPYNSKEIKKNIKILIGSKMISGQVPSIYQDGYQKETKILSRTK